MTLSYNNYNIIEHAMHGQKMCIRLNTNSVCVGKKKKKLHKYPTRLHCDPVELVPLTLNDGK